MRITPNQVADGSVDEVNLSVVTAHRRADNDRYGTIYTPATLAAAVPVHFHRINPTTFLMLFSKRWHTATVSSTDPGAYTAFTEDTTPGWVRVSVPTGATTLQGQNYAIPISAAHDTAVLTDAVSRSDNYLYVLCSITTGSTTTGVVSNWTNNPTTGSLTLVAEETLPVGVTRPAATAEQDWLELSAQERQAAGDTVVYDRGLQFQTPYLTVFGVSADYRLFAARKPWGRIGYNLVPTRKAELPGGMITMSPDDPRWTYYTGTGWSTDITLAAPLTDTTGTVITTRGPVSVVSYTNHTWLATVIADGNNRLAQLYTQRGGRSWIKGDTVALGSPSGGTYVGDTLRFQQHVLALGTSATATDPDNQAAIPYVVTLKNVTSGRSALRNTWSLLPVPRRF